MLRRKLWMGISVLLFFSIILLLYGGESLWGRWLYPVRYEAEVLRYAERHQVDPYLVFAVIRVESNFSPDKTSPKGARGLMQLMPATEKWIREQIAPPLAQRRDAYDPETNIAYGTWYMRQISEQEESSSLTAADQIARLAAAYNAGPTKSAAWIREGVWNGTMKDIENIPYGETRHYIERVWYFYQKYVQHAPMMERATDAAHHRGTYPDRIGATAYFSQ